MLSTVSKKFLLTRKPIISLTQTALKTSFTAVCVTQSKQIQSRPFHNNAIAYNKAPKDKDDKTVNNEQAPPSSILNEDLLMKAGFDVDAKTQEQEHADSKEGASESTTTGGSKEGRQRRRRVSSTDLQREKMSNLFYVVLLGGAIGFGIYMGREFEESELNSKDKAEFLKIEQAGYAPKVVYQRAKLRYDLFIKSFSEPPFDDLLPPPPPPPYQRPLTLVIALEDLLIHCEWSAQGGWKTKKRPGCDFFLGYLSQYYEIVVFSDNSMMYAEPVIQKIDPINAFIAYSLYKEHCVIRKGEPVKDLSKLNRDMGKIICIDSNENEVQLQPENVIPLKPWNGEDDKGAGLLELIPFLEYIVTQNVSDVRPVLNSFKDKYELSHEFQERVDHLREKFDNEQKASKGSVLMKLLGATGVSSPSSAAGSMQSKFPLDFIREEGLNNYKRFMRLVEEEKEKIEFKQQRMKQTFTLDQYLTGQLTQEEMMKQQLAKDKELEEEFVKFKSEQKKEQQTTN